jgi:hypothetical protein
LYSNDWIVIIRNDKLEAIDEVVKSLEADLEEEGNETNNYTLKNLYSIDKKDL